MYARTMIHISLKLLDATPMLFVSKAHSPQQPKVNSTDFSVSATCKDFHERTQLKEFVRLVFPPGITPKIIIIINCAKTEHAGGGGRTARGDESKLDTRSLGL